jgi:hypothetical protein
MKLDQRGKVIEEETDDDLASDPNVLIVQPTNDFGIRTTEKNNGTP